MAKGKLTSTDSLRSVAALLLHSGPISRAELSKRSGFSKQTTSEVIGTLEANGLVRAIGRTNGQVGRTAIVYDVVPEAAYAAGVDLGGTRTLAALVDTMGNVVAQSSTRTDTRGGNFLIDQIGSIVTALARSANLDPAKIRQVAIGSPGVIDYYTGRIQLSPNIRGLDMLNIPELVKASIGAEVSIENDVNLALVGEHWQGRARGFNNAALISVGTGVGLGFTANGVLIRGSSGAAGEIAYLPIGSDLHSPPTLINGALERDAGAAGILRRYNEAVPIAAETVAEIFTRAAAGDPTAARVIDDTALDLAKAIVAICAILDPEIVIMAGGIGSRPELLAATRQRLPTLLSRPIRLEASELAGYSGLVGALAMALNRLHATMFGTSGTTGAEFENVVRDGEAASGRVGRDILEKMM